MQDFLHQHERFEKRPYGIFANGPVSSDHFMKSTFPGQSHEDGGEAGVVAESVLIASGD
jgi:hypothetical protein